jgi:hypothetical protein
VNGVGYKGICYDSPVRIELNFSAFRDYVSYRAAIQRWKLLQEVYRYYRDKRFKITELHFAIDLPYPYCSIGIGPPKYLKSSKYPSTQYFDSRRKKETNSKHNIIIYDKSLKAHIAMPMTRLELRLEFEELKSLMAGQCLIVDAAVQEELKRKIDKKFNDMIVKKGSHEILLRWSCDRFDAITSVMEYLCGDDSLLEKLMAHHTAKIIHAHKIFTRFIDECKKHKVYYLKQKLPLALKPYLMSLSAEDRQMIANTVENHYKCNRKWYVAEEFLGENIPNKRKYKRIDSLSEEEMKEIQSLYEYGISMKDIGIKFGLSESAISRLFARQGKRRVYIKDSPMVGLFGFY